MLTVEQLAKELIQAGVVSQKGIQAALKSIDTDSHGESSLQDFIEELRQQKQLTDFQASELSGGRTERVVIGGYILLERIGHGGMGEIFRAHHLIMNRDVVLKFMLPTMDYNEDSVKRFQREVRTASKLNHPRIVRALDAGIHNGVSYLVMDYVAGQDLARLVRTRGALSLGIAIEFTRQIAEALQYAHSQGVIHRDVKPSNVLFDPSTRSIKILDMGLATVVTADDQDGLTKTGPTSSGQVLGTADYLSPEQYADPSSAGPPADLYGLGCTLHFLLTGRPPYVGRDKAEKMIAHCQHPIPDLRQHDPKIPHEVQRVFERLMAKDPADRYQDAAAVIADLRELRKAGIIDENSAALEFAPTDFQQENWAESGVDPLATTVRDDFRDRRFRVGSVSGWLVAAVLGFAGWQAFSHLSHPRVHPPDQDAALLSQQPDEIEYRPIPLIDEVQWPTELVDYIYPDRDTVSGYGWSLVDGVLTTGVGRATLLDIQHPVPASYRLTIKLRRLAGDAPVYVGLPFASAHGYAMVDRKGTSGIGLNESGRMHQLVSTIRLPIDEWHVLRFDVAAHQIRLFFDDVESCAFVGQTASMRLPDALAIGETCGIFLGANNWSVYVSQFEFQSVLLEPLIEEGLSDSFADQ